MAYNCARYAVNAASGRDARKTAVGGLLLYPLINCQNFAALACGGTSFPHALCVHSSSFTPWGRDVGYLYVVSRYAFRMIASHACG